MNDAASAAPSEREKFEAWLHDNFGKRSIVRAPDGYAHSVAHAALPSTYASVQMLWEAWQAARRAKPAPPTADQEPFGYFRAEPFGWTDCAETDEGAIALYDRPAPPAVVEPFTAAQRERMFRNRPSDVGKDLSLADWHRVLQYVEACHGIGIKKGDSHG